MQSIAATKANVNLGEVILKSATSKKMLNAFANQTLKVYQLVVSRDVTSVVPVQCQNMESWDFIY